MSEEKSKKQKQKKKTAKSILFKTGLFHKSIYSAVNARVLFYYYFLIRLRYLHLMQYCTFYHFIFFKTYINEKVNTDI